MGRGSTVSKAPNLITSLTPHGCFSTYNDLSQSPGIHTSMPTITIIFIATALVILYFSRFCLRKQPNLTGEELANLHPELGSIKLIYSVTYPLIALLSTIPFSVANSIYAQTDLRVWSLIVLLPSALAFYDGLFALLTRVYPTTTKSNWNQFVYDENLSLRWIAQTQLGLAILQMVAILIAFLVS
jgi:hypothetical protein